MPIIFGDPEPNEKGSMSARVQEAMRELVTVIGSLDSARARFEKRDELLFGMMVTSVQQRDNARATILANELAEVRKYARMIAGSRLALEQMVVRLNTIGQLGDVVSALEPATVLIGSLRQGLRELMPETEGRMGEISGLLNEILALATSGADGSTQSQPNLAPVAVGEDAERLLSEAAALADSRMITKKKSKEFTEDEEPLPEVPENLPGSEMDMEPA